MTRDDVKNKIDDTATKAKDAVDELADKAKALRKKWERRSRRRDRKSINPRNS